MDEKVRNGEESKKIDLKSKTRIKTEDVQEVEKMFRLCLCGSGK